MIVHLSDQLREVGGVRRAARLGITDHSLRHAALLDACDFRQRLDHLEPRDANPQFPSDELEEDQPFVGRHRLTQHFSRA